MAKSSYLKSWAKFRGIGHTHQKLNRTDSKISIHKRSQTQQR